ncbi:MAG: hypothetical protein KAW12_20440 [Candidatus Aminicenantes bacterium]|nr:hypothetical protein [Candidatus Aminicenantes bacterium]
MVQVDLPAAFAMGQIYALLSKNYLKKEPNKFTNKLLGPFNLFLTCGFVPTGMFLMVAWPAWEIMFVSSWVEKPFDRPLVAAFYVVFMLAMIILGNVGYILAHHWYRKGKDKWVVYGSIIGVIVTALPFFLRWGVWWKIGTFAEINAGQGYSFFKPPFFYGWLCFIVYMVAMLIIGGFWFRKKGALETPG